ncbi:MAG: hypothetical protein MUE47_11270 [Acidobacteria bacterium]|nr:hypothetical protein [Acidobacteriota bacterium]
MRAAPDTVSASAFALWLAGHGGRLPVLDLAVALHAVEGLRAEARKVFARYRAA